MRFRRLERQYDKNAAQVQRQKAIVKAERAAATSELNRLFKVADAQSARFNALQKQVAFFTEMMRADCGSEAMAKDRAEIRKMAAESHALHDQVESMAKRVGIGDLRKANAPSTITIQ